MKKEALKKIINECCNDVVFSYNGKISGITSEVHDYIPIFQVWHGENIKEYTDIDEVMSDMFYSGRSLNDLADIIEFEIL